MSRHRDGDKRNGHEQRENESESGICRQEFELQTDRLYNNHSAP